MGTCSPVHNSKMALVPLSKKVKANLETPEFGEAVAQAEKVLVHLVGQLNSLRQRAGEAIKNCQACEKAEALLEMELAKSQKEIDSLNERHKYIEKQIDSLRVASQPKKDELNRLKELESIISTEERELEKLSKCSSKLKERASELQKKIQNAGG